MQKDMFFNPLQRIQSGLKKKETLFVILLSILCFLIHIYGIEKLYSPFLYTEEMGYWANAAIMAGYDWSPSIIRGAIPWYSYGYSFILLPLYFLFDDMVSMYRAAIVLNGFWAVLIFLLCYSIAKKIAKNQNQYILAAIAFVVSIYSGYLHQSSIAVVETFLYFWVWLVFWLFIRYEERPHPTRGICLGCAAAYLYLIHHRTVGILVAFALTIAYMLIMRKIRLKDLVYIVIPIVVIFCIDHKAVDFFSKNIWGVSNISNQDYEKQMDNIQKIFSDRSFFVRFLKSVVGKYWYACTSSFMICVWGAINAFQKIINDVKNKTQKFNYHFSYVFFALAYFGMTAISAIFTINQGNAMTRIDFIVYGRYAECAVGIFLLLGFLELLNIHAWPKKKKLFIAISVFGAYILSFFVIEEYASMLTQLVNGNMVLPSTQVNSTPGIFFYSLIGQFSFWNCTFIALIIAITVFFVFANASRKILFMICAYALIITFWGYSAWYSFNIYTYQNQVGNNQQEFVELVQAVESNVKGKNIFIESDNIYVYFDFQNRMIHNTIYPGHLKDINNDTKYDVLIIPTDTFEGIPGGNYQIWMINNKYIMLCSKELEEELQIDTQDDWLTYDFGEKEIFQFSGFSGNEVQHRWSCESPAAVQVTTLESEKDYKCKVLFGTVIPLSQLGMEKFSGSVVINHHDQQKINFTILPDDMGFQFEIDRSLLAEDGNNIMEFYTPLWSPSDYGSPDTRTLGINIDKIIFEEIQ